MSNIETVTRYTELCRVSDLVPQSGVAVVVEGRQLALFYLPGDTDQIFALDNLDPFSDAFVLARGIVGDFKGHVVVASPIYKQHFDLKSGQCVEDSSVKVATHEVLIDDDRVLLAG